MNQNETYNLFIQTGFRKYQLVDQTFNRVIDATRFASANFPGKKYIIKTSIETQVILQQMAQQEQRQEQLQEVKEKVSEVVKPVKKQVQKYFNRNQPSPTEPPRLSHAQNIFKMTHETPQNVFKQSKETSQNIFKQTHEQPINIFNRNTDPVENIFKQNPNPPPMNHIVRLPSQMSPRPFHPSILRAPQRPPPKQLNFKGRRK